LVCMGDTGMLCKHGDCVLFTGRRYYPVAYEVKRVLGYITLGVGLYLAREQLPAGVAGNSHGYLSIEFECRLYFGNSAF